MAVESPFSQKFPPPFGNVKGGHKAPPVLIGPILNGSEGQDRAAGGFPRFQRAMGGGHIGQRETLINPN